MEPEIHMEPEVLEAYQRLMNQSCDFLIAAGKARKSGDFKIVDELVKKGMELHDKAQAINPWAKKESATQS